MLAGVGREGGGEVVVFLILTHSCFEFHAINKQQFRILLAVLKKEVMLKYYVLCLLLFICIFLLLSYFRCIMWFRQGPE